MGYKISTHCDDICATHLPYCHCTVCFDSTRNSTLVTFCLSSSDCWSCGMASTLLRSMLALYSLVALAVLTTKSTALPLRDQSAGQPGVPPQNQQVYLVAGTGAQVAGFESFLGPRTVGEKAKNFVHNVVCMGSCVAKQVAPVTEINLHDHPPFPRPRTRTGSRSSQLAAQLAARPAGGSAPLPGPRTRKGSKSSQQAAQLDARPAGGSGGRPASASGGRSAGSRLEARPGSARTLVIGASPSAAVHRRPAAASASSDRGKGKEVQLSTATSKDKGKGKAPAVHETHSDSSSSSSSPERPLMSGHGGTSGSKTHHA